MKGSAAARTALALASLALIAGGAFAGYSEVRSFLATGLTDPERVSAYSSGPIPTGLSIVSQRGVLENCVRAVIAAGVRPQPKG